MNLKKKIRIDFCSLGYNHSKTSHFLYRLLSKHFDLELCDHPDFLVHDAHGYSHHLYSGVRILFTGEKDAPDFRVDDYSVSGCQMQHPRHFHMPAYVIRGPAEKIIKQHDDHERIFASKTKFCSFVVSNHSWRKNRNRFDIFDKLSRYKKVDSGGKFMNNIGGPLSGGRFVNNGDGPNSVVVDKYNFLLPYKFNICFENAPDFISEKIYDAMAARCLPIYWGDKRINQHFNPRSFLNRMDFPSDEAFIEKIIELDQNDAKYMEYMRQPYLPEDKPTTHFDLNRLVNFFEHIFSTPIQPVAQRRRWFKFGRWILVKRYHDHPFPKNMRREMMSEGFW